MMERLKPLTLITMVTIILQKGVLTEAARDKPPPPPPPIDSWVTPDISTSNGEGNLTIPEGLKGDSSIFIVTSPDATSFALTEQSHAGLFTVGEDSGLIFVGGEYVLDYDNSFRVATMVIEAVAPDESTSTATISVWLEDVNDETPVFSKALTRIVVPETTRSGDVIARLTVSDGDVTPDFRSVILTVTDGDSDGLFTVFDDGEVKVAERKNLFNASAYYLTVTASDGVNEATTNIIVGVCSTRVLTTLQNGCDAITSNMAAFVVVLLRFIIAFL